MFSVALRPETVRTVRAQDGHLHFHTVPCSVLLYVQRPYGLLGPRTATSTFTQFLVQCCFTSTETVRTVRAQDGHLHFHTVPCSVLLYVQRPYGLLGPRTATSTFTQFLVQCCFTSTETVRTVRAQDGHLHFHTVPCSVLLYVQRPYGLLGPRTATSTFTQFLVQCCFTSQRPYGLLGPRTATSTFTQFLVQCCFTSRDRTDC